MKQWEEALEMVKARDVAIENESEKYATQHGRARGLRDKMKDQKKYLDHEVANNRELDARIALGEREVGQLRETHYKEIEKVSVRNSTHTLTPSPTP